MTDNKQRSLIQQAIMQIGSGGSAGFLEVCIMHPLDLIKTRMQLQVKSVNVSSATGNLYYNGVFDCARKMVRSEGVYSLYKGILPPILVETPKRAVKFLTFEQLKKLFMFGNEKPTALTFSMAGLGAGVLEAILVNPFEMIKVTLQTNRAVGKEIPSTWATTKNIIENDGVGSRGLNRGLSATIFRNGSFNMIYFGFYHSVKNYFPEYKDPTQEFLRKCAIGFTSGTLGSVFNIPFDVAKSRIQGPQPQPGVVKYKSTFATIGTVYKEEGFRALYKGLTPKVMRLGPGGAIMLVVYDYVYELLDNHFD